MSRGGLIGSADIIWSDTSKQLNSWEISCNILRRISLNHDTININCLVTIGTRSANPKCVIVQDTDCNGTYCLLVPVTVYLPCVYHTPSNSSVMAWHAKSLTSLQFFLHVACHFLRYTLKTKHSSKSTQIGMKNLPEETSRKTSFGEDSSRVPSLCVLSCRG